MAKKYWIKERLNPQFKKAIYSTYGAATLTKKQIEKMENPVYGINIMHSFKTKKEYLARIEELKSEGETIMVKTGTI
jgi:hypothetical protein